MKRLILIIVALQLVHTLAYCWSAPGHEAIAIAAMAMLKGTPTETKVNEILDGEKPEDAAIWLDLVRENLLTDPDAKQEAKVFGENFHNNDEWHYCNFIVGSTKYSSQSKYAATNDVVHALEAAIAVLEGAPSKMTKKQAMRCVFHLVGDIHQPLHCITGFYDLSDMSKPVALTDVADPKTATQDRGGNQLMYTHTENLHHYWDLVLPNAVARHGSTLAETITVASLSSEPVTSGDFHKWPEVWASGSMKEANAAYDGITFDSAAFVDDPHHPGHKKLEITIKLPGGQSQYKADQLPRAKSQLTLAAVRLAQLLSNINYQ